MKKILYPFVGDSVGGSHIATIMTIKNLDSRRFYYEVVLEKRGPLEKVLKINKIKYYFLTNSKSSNFFLTYLKRFLYLNRSKPNIVHTNDLRMHQSWTILCFLRRISHLWHQHTYYNSRINRVFLLFSKKIITISKFCLKSYSVKMKNKVEIILNPFESFKYENFNNTSKNSLRRRLGFKSKDKILIYVGDDNCQKRFDFFMLVAKEISKKFKSTKFLIFIKKINNKIIKSKNVYYFNGKFDIDNYLKISDVLISPSVNEGFGRVLVEATFSKTLVIASNSGGHNEIIKNEFNGFLVPKDSKQQFIKKISYSLQNYDNEKIQKIIKRAFLYSKKKYNLKYYKQEIFSIYDKL